MRNKNYEKGRKFEYEMKELYESLGCLVFRTAGSHSIADLIAIPNTILSFQKPILIQCKTSKKINPIEKN
ncbi:MAG: hypothetical protein MUO82_10785 [Candidatus Thermoplasmatota archaeon]|nr:hypothetical protein [Candidatus Thermoplasmatota archaeon]